MRIKKTCPNFRFGDGDFVFVPEKYYKLVEEKPTEIVYYLIPFNYLVRLWYKLKDD